MTTPFPSTTTPSAIPLREAIQRHAIERGHDVAIEWGHRSTPSRLRYQELPHAIELVSRAIKRLGDGTVAMLCENGPDGILADLALRELRTFVPLPSFFSDAQVLHALLSTRSRFLLTDDPVRARAIARTSPELTVTNQRSVDPLRSLHLLTLEHPTPEANLADSGSPRRVTYTSGTTGKPKGVCLKADTEDRVSAAIAQAMNATPGERHLCLHPFPVLLETVGGVYRTLRSGGSVVVRTSTEVGTVDAIASDGGKLIDALDREHAAVAILVPELLKDLVVERERGAKPPCALRFLGVGGARVPVSLLERAEDVGLPVYEGYGLTEACSVVCLNTEEHRRIGTVGKPLPHSTVFTTEDGEVAVRGALLDGYHGDGFHGDGYHGDGFHGDEVSSNHDVHLTGDFGEIDADGYLTLQGRKSDVICTSYGRNISAQWLEEVLTDNTPFEHARVYGDGLPGPVAELSGPRDHATARAALDQIHEALPAYARIRWFSLTRGEREPLPQPRPITDSDFAR